MDKTETRSLLSQIVRPEVKVVEHFGPAQLISGPELDAGLLDHAVAARRAEFSMGRHCAREACKRIDRPCDFIGILPGRAPAWPQGVIGSITHCKGYIAAAVCRSEIVRFLGIDAEPFEPLPERLIDLIAFGTEKDWLLETADLSYDGRLLFCAKEAVFKSWWPVYGSWLNFNDVGVEIDHKHGTFQAIVNGSTKSISLKGYFIIDHGFVAAAVSE